MTRDPDIRAATYIHIAGALRTHAPAIARQWAQQSGEADALAIFGRSVAELLAQMSAALAGGDGEGTAAAETPAQSPPGAPDVPRMLRAFQSLRQIVLPAVADELHRDLRLDEVVALNRELDGRMLQRVAGVAERRLADLRCIADSRSQYMSFLSHDLRGSLNGVVLMLEVMRREAEARPDRAESLEDITLMRRSILQSVAMMERYLLLDQLRQGKDKLSIVPLDAQALAAEVAAELADGELGGAVVVDIPPATTVVADRQLLHISLLNLAENALKAGSRSPVKICGEAQGSTCILSVADEGSGMSPERVRELLDPNRPRNSRDRGVGLALVHEAVRAMAGRLDAQSRLGHGSVFMLILPTEHTGQKAVEPMV